MSDAQIPKFILDRLQALEDKLRDQQSTAAVKIQENDYLKKVRLESLFAGIGKPNDKSATYKHKSYPGWRFHLTEDAKIVNNEQEDAALGDDWYRTMEDFIAAQKATEEPKRPGKKA